MSTVAVYRSAVCNNQFTVEITAQTGADTGAIVSTFALHFHISCDGDRSAEMLTTITADGCTLGGVVGTVVVDIQHIVAVAVALNGQICIAYMDSCSVAVGAAFFDRINGIGAADGHFDGGTVFDVNARGVLVRNNDHILDGKLSGLSLAAGNRDGIGGFSGGFFHCDDGGAGFLMGSAVSLLYILIGILINTNVDAALLQIPCFCQYRQA